jgi:hypothetical protein
MPLPVNPEDLKSIPTITEIFGGKVSQLARYCDEPIWTAFNPSVCYTEEHGYLVLIRSTNGGLKDHRPEWQTELGEELTSPDTYNTPSEYYVDVFVDGKYGSEVMYRNRMFIANLNPNTLKLSKIREVDLSEAYDKAPYAVVRGVEDGRLHHASDGLRISATFYEPNKSPAVQMCSMKLDLSGKTPKATSLDIFESPKGRTINEKNWMPVDRLSLYNPNDVSFDYWYQSTETFNIESKKLNNSGGHQLPVSGSSQLVGLENGTLLGIIHQRDLSQKMRFTDITKPAINRRCYSHRFLQFDEQGRILKVTDKFNFLNKSVEFASGIAIHEKNVLVTFGALDSSAHITSVPLKNILSSLRPPKI